MKKSTILIILALAAPAVFAQSTPAPAPPATTTATAAPDADPIVVSASGITVRKSEFEAALKTLPAEYQSYAQGPGKKQFADDYLRMRLLAAEGMKAGMQNSPEVVNQLNLMRENLVATAQLKKIDSGITVTDAEVQKAYTDGAKDYEQVKARHILIAPKGSPAAQTGKKELTDDEAKAKAEDLRKQILAGANFEELAKKESDDAGSGARGGDLGSFAHGQMVPEFEAAAFAAKIGEVTPVVKTQFGYHIIKVEAHDSTPLAQVRPTIEKNLKQSKLHAALEAMRESAHPVYDEKYFAPPPAPPVAGAPSATPAPKVDTAAPKSDAKKDTAAPKKDTPAKKKP
ncbi:MAG: peptidyl-prolyl cis-trans isomerase [Thermoanaerobaculia bacterium]|nr:peptidyl-prolyl cis-trans isomerase [Thermoanaerobaculia bacterium]